ncbi:MAG TPA: MBL fold metallo-hydrolase [Acidimicrobiales bacterium]|nr:MAG: MBL fold metallo-hydrolase [Actinobacteria bacterium 21-73-9]HQU26443.1 MBL fold metallo-hydrolase [Acidimicrobiales bacterium]
MTSRLYLRQWLSGRDFALGDPVAVAMRNFAYALGDRETGEAVLVDPAYAPRELVDLVAAESMTVVGAVATHAHPDHVGGRLMGEHVVAGVAELVAATGVVVHAQAVEVDTLVERTGVDPARVVGHDDYDHLRLGELDVTLVRTPGHTPGSQCLWVDDALLSGDTLFVEGCGRTDLPGGSSDEIYASIHERLAIVPDETTLYPGHFYAEEPHAPLGRVRASNSVFLVRSLAQWRASFG